MASPKTFSFTIEEQLISTLGKSINHPARVRMVQLLLNHGCLPYDQLVANSPLADSTNYHHFTMLQKLGVLVRQDLGEGSAGYMLESEVYGRLAALFQGTCMGHDFEDFVIIRGGPRVVYQ